jgi:hypothetical protein
MEWDSLLEIVATHCPVFYVCADDVNGYPSSFDHFARHSCVVCSESGRVIIEELESTTELREYLNSPSAVPVDLKLNTEAARRGEVDTPIDDIPVYAKVKGLMNEDALEALEITYITLFTHNGSYPVLFGAFLLGRHDGDVEHVTVRVSLKDGLCGVWFNSHRNHDGCWVAAQDVELDSATGRIVSYIARAGHGHYPTPGTYYRHFGLANDYTKKDRKWQPKRVVWIGNPSGVSSTPSKGPVAELYGKPRVQVVVSQLPEVVVDAENYWITHEKLQKFGETPSPSKQCWFHDAEPIASRHWFLKLFVHFWPPQ